MPRSKSALPAYRLHKATNRAVVYIDRREIYLGVYNSRESRRRYSELVTKLKKGDPVGPVSAAQNAEAVVGPSVASLCLRFIAEKLPKYADAEQHSFRGAIKIVGELFGETPVHEFGPIRLRLVRDEMIKKGWSRVYINKQIKRVRHVFNWGVGWEIVPESTAAALGKVEPLAAGESIASESRPREAVSPARLAAVRVELCDRHRDVFDLLLLTGARPAEILSLTTGQIDRSDEVWRAELVSHKTAHKGKSRTLYFNATAQAILQRYLSANLGTQIFPIRRDNFGQSVKKACERAFKMPKELRFPDKKLAPAKLDDIKRQAKAWRQEHVFTPHWLRHTVATRLANEMGVESAQRLLGHAGKAMTEHYSRAAERLAIEAAQRLG